VYVCLAKAHPVGEPLVHYCQWSACNSRASVLAYRHTRCP